MPGEDIWEVPTRLQYSLEKPNEEIWFARVTGRQMLGQMVSTMCKEAEIPGFRTNHSLQSSTATRLYEAGVDEQTITEITGHRSNAVRGYKRTNSALRMEASEIVQGLKNVQRPAAVPLPLKMMMTGSPLT